ncbi:MAG: hypothetical protein V1754_03450, partial [Pseudomonadota bacterium]
RSKTNFGANFHRAMLRYEQERVRKVILDNPDQIASYLDIAVLRRIYRRYFHEGETRYGLALWKAAVLAQWLEQTGLMP